MAPERPRLSQRPTQSETPRQPERLMDRLLGIVEAIIVNKRAKLEEEYGDASDYGIKGVVVVGSVAARRERPDSDLDLYVLSTTGDDFLDEFLEMLSRRARRIIDIGTVYPIPEGHRLTQEEWLKYMEEGKFNLKKPFQIIQIE